MSRTLSGNHDRERVLRLLGEQGPLSHLELARLAHLESTAVSSIVADLTSLDLVRESRPSPATGENGGEALLTLSPASAWAIGLDLHSAGIKLYLTNGAGQIIAQQTFSPQKDITRFADDLVGALETHAQGLKLASSKCAGLGISVPGIVNPTTGTVTKPEWDWKNFPLRDLFAKRLGIDVHVERDVVCGAFGEKHAGRARKCENFLYILIQPSLEKTPAQISQSYGYGLAIVVDGRIHRGSNNAAGEILTLDPMTVEMPLDDEGHPIGPEIAGLLDSLGKTAASLTNIIDPELIILCAEHHLLSPERMEIIERVAREQIFDIEARRFRLVHSTLSLDGLAYGAAVLRLHRFLQKQLTN